MTRLSALLAATVAFVLAGTDTVSGAPSPIVGARNIVIVHGAFADGSGWKAVSNILSKDGYSVSVVQPPLTSLEDDVAATARILDRQEGPVVLVGHSYGGAVITEAGNDPKVMALVYVAAFAPDQGEVLGGLLQSKPGASTGIARSADGFLFLRTSVFAADFAGDLPERQAEFMALSQMPVAAKAFGTPIRSPAWKAKTYGIVATEDRIINPDLERSMYERADARVTEIRGSHVVFISQPHAVARVIETAAQGAK